MRVLPAVTTHGHVGADLQMYFWFAAVLPGALCLGHQPLAEGTGETGGGSVWQIATRCFSWSPRWEVHPLHLRVLPACEWGPWLSV